MSGAMPNKCCVMKGSVDVTPGQHFAVIGGIDTWRERGWNHPKRYPIEKGFIQVHHFKWDSTVLERLKEVSETKEDYSYWKEYKKMYRGMHVFDWKIDINNPNFMVYSNDSFEDPDKRDYIVSNEKIESTGWKPIYKLNDGIEELIKTYEILSHSINLNYRNELPLSYGKK